MFSSETLNFSLFSSNIILNFFVYVLRKFITINWPEVIDCHSDFVNKRKVQDTGLRYFSLLQYNLLLYFWLHTYLLWCINNHLIKDNVSYYTYKNIGIIKHFIRDM